MTRKTRWTLILFGGAVPVAIACGLLAYVIWGYDGPTSEWTVIGKGEAALVMDGSAQWTFVRREEIVREPHFLARWTGKVKEVRYDSPEGFVKAYVWRRCLPKDWTGFRK